MTTQSLDAYPNVDDWLVFGAGRVTVRTGKVDIGQRISTALALIAAEELDVAFERIDIDDVDTSNSLDEEYTSASNSLERCGQSVRLAAATARRHLLALAAHALAMDVSALKIDDGCVGPGTGAKSTTYWELMRGKRFGIPVDVGIAPKASSEYKLIGRSVTAIDLVDLVGGRAPFVHDLSMPGMLHARLVRPPHYHARIAEIDASIADRLAGAQLVQDGSFLAVVAADEHRAVRAAALVAGAVRWTSERPLDTTSIYELLVTSPAISMPVRNGEAFSETPPPLQPPPVEAATTLHTRIERPYLMHGSIGPSAALALWEDGNLTVWTHTQGVFPLRATIAESLGIEISQVRLIQKRGPGCYGHNGADDAALDAALIARSVSGRPVMLKWSREDEHAWEPYGPAMVVEVRASIDRNGRIVDWSHDTWSDTHRTRPRPGPNGVGPARMLSTHFVRHPVPAFVPEPFLSVPLAGVHRNADPYYTIPRRRVVKHLVRGMPLRTSTLRTLGSYTNVMAIETMMDELACSAGIDPLTFRMEHLDDPRAHAVLKAVADLAQWNTRKPAPGHGRGLAFARYNNRKAYAAAIVDLSVNDAAQVRIDKVWIAADAGQIVDPDGLRLQLEGGAFQAVSWTLCEQVTFDAGGITSRDWESYPMLRFDRAPDVETILIDRPGEPYLGPSECSVAPTAAAVANAIHDAIGLRLHRLPFNADAIRAAALQ